MYRSRAVGIGQSAYSSMALAVCMSAGPSMASGRARRLARCALQWVGDTVALYSLDESFAGVARGSLAPLGVARSATLPGQCRPQSATVHWRIDRRSRVLLQRGRTSPRCALSAARQPTSHLLAVPPATEQATGERISGSSPRALERECVASAIVLLSTRCADRAMTPSPNPVTMPPHILHLPSLARRQQQSVPACLHSSLRAWTARLPP